MMLQVSEKELMRELIRKKLGGGKSTFEYLIGDSKKIDLVYKTDRITWIIEAKKKLNYRAIGQVLVYKNLYRQENKEEIVRMGVVCFELDNNLIKTCRNRSIKIFRIMDIQRESNELEELIGIIKILEKDLNMGSIPFQKVEKEAESKGFDISFLNSLIRKGKKKGLLYSPDENSISVV